VEGDRNNPQQIRPDGTDGAQENANWNRREALLKIGQFGIYTSPALLAMLTGEAYAQGDSLITKD
jgi:hypothetical protein